MTDSPQHIPFMKMHGLGNDFVVIDERCTGEIITPDLAIAMGKRHEGVGFDQLATIRACDEADIALQFWNSDGSMSGACGNATRCVAAYEMSQRNTDSLTVKTERGVLPTWRDAQSVVTVNMGTPFTAWQDIPLARAVDTDCLPIDGSPVATGMGNPHCTFFVDDIATIDLEEFGPRFEHHPLFPERTNVQIAQVLSPEHIRVRVWERGAGLTLASGSSSCAVAVAAVRRGLSNRRVKISLDGGDIVIEWCDDGVLMTGATAHVFDGIWRGHI